MPDLLDAAQEKPLKIVKLTIENVKKIKVLTITPDGNLVLLTGPNGAGKTSAMDSIFWCLKGAGVVQSAPIRNGEETARIRLGLGTDDVEEIIVTRTFHRVDGDEFTTSVKVVGADGTKITKAQEFLNKISGPGGIAFDPVIFARSKPKDQFETLRRFVPNIDFDEIDRANKKDFDKRTEINRDAGQRRAQAEAIEIPETIAKERVDEIAIVEAIGNAGKHNGEIEARKARREQAPKDVAAKRDVAQGHRDRAAELRRQADQADDAAKKADAEADELQARIDAAPPLPDPIDVEALKANLDAAKRTNAMIDRARERETLLVEAADLEKQSEALTDKIKQRNEDKRAKIAAAEMPVAGLGFGEDYITFNGVPFDQASAAEQLRVSVAIAMASNPRLKVVLIRDASLLDKKSLTMVTEMAQANDCYVWAEYVDDSGENGIVFEDGSIVSTPKSRAAGKRQAGHQQAAE